MTWGNAHSISSQREISRHCLGKLLNFVTPFDSFFILKKSWIPKTPRAISALVSSLPVEEFNQSEYIT